MRGIIGIGLMIWGVTVLKDQFADFTQVEGAAIGLIVGGAGFLGMWIKEC